MHSKDSIILALRVTTLLDASLLPFRARVVFRVGQVKGIPTVRSTNRQHVRVPVHTLTVQNRALQVRQRASMQHARHLLVRAPVLIRVNRAPHTARVVLNANTTPHKVLIIPVSMRLSFALTPPTTFRHNRHRVHTSVHTAAVRTIRRRVITNRFNSTLTAPLHVGARNTNQGHVMFNMISLMRRHKGIFIIVITRRSTHVFRQRKRMTIRTTVKCSRRQRQVSSTNLHITTTRRIASQTLRKQNFLTVPVRFRSRIAGRIQANEQHTINSNRPGVASRTQAIRVRRDSTLPHFRNLSTQATLTQQTGYANYDNHDTLTTHKVLNIRTAYTP